MSQELLLWGIGPPVLLCTAVLLALFRPWGHGAASAANWAGANALAPDLMSAAERLPEIAAILAAGLLRLRRQQQSGPWVEKNALDFTTARSVHATTRRRRKVAR